MKFSAALKFSVALALASMASGCLTVFPDPKPAPQIFRLDPPENAFESTPKVDWTVSVARPSAPRTLSGADLVLREGDSRIVYVEGSEWAEPVPGLMQRMLTAALDRSGKIIAVTTEAGARADCELQWDLYAFDVRQGAHGFSARFEAGVRLIEGRRRMITQSTQVYGAGETSGESARAAAAALTKAAQEGVTKAGAWALAQQCEKLPRYTPSSPGGAPEASLAGAPDTPNAQPAADPKVGARPVMPTD